MSKVRIEINLPGINAIMKSDGMKSAIKQAADQVASIAGEGYVAEDPREINWIGIVNVYPEDKKAGHDNFENNTLIKAAYAAGLKMSKGGTR